MRALLLVLLLAPPVGAVDMELPGAPAQHAREVIETLPFEARLELHRMFLSYRDEVELRVDEGWTPGLLSDAVIEDLDDPFQPARLLEDTEKNHRSLLADQKAALAKMSADSPGYARQERRVDDEREVVATARQRNAREKGICRDWSDDVWFLLTKMDLDRWTVDDRRRDARPFHSAAVACSPQEKPVVCLAFDPWTEGKPSVYSYLAWNAKEAGGRIPADFFLHDLPEKEP